MGNGVQTFFERPDGLFYFQEFYEDHEDLRHLGYGIETFTSPGFTSGLYNLREDAEAEICAVVPWLRAGSR